MSMNFAQMKKNASSNSAVEELQKKLKEKTRSGRDERFWYPSTNQDGNGSAVIRFLPAPPGEDLPWVTYWHHWFKVGNKAYGENSLTSIGKDDPVAEENSRLWDIGTDGAKALARARKRKQKIVTNIYVVKDPANPDNDGKVFLYRFGPVIWEKLQGKIQPEYEDEDPVDIFNLWNGANFRIRIKQKGDYRNYDDSSFDSVAPLMDDDAKLEAIWKQCHSLEAFIAPEAFKSYAELKAKFEDVIGTQGREIQSAEADLDAMSAPEETEAPIDFDAEAKKPADASDDIFGDDDDIFGNTSSEYETDDDIPF